MEFWHGKIMSYDQMTLLDLKKLCKERGLKVSGRKDEVVIRLMESDEARGSPTNANSIILYTNSINDWTNASVFSSCLRQNDQFRNSSFQ